MECVGKYILLLATVLYLIRFMFLGFFIILVNASKTMGKSVSLTRRISFGNLPWALNRARLGGLPEITAVFERGKYNRT